MLHSLLPQFVVVFWAQETMQPEYVSLWLRKDSATKIGAVSEEARR